MHLSESSFSLRSPILIAAFEGWNDAAESATSAITHLLRFVDARNTTIFRSIGHR